MILTSTTRKQRQRGCRPFPLHPQSPPNLLRFGSDHLSRPISLDEAEHFLHNHHASVASLRLLFTFTPERRSACLRNRCSPSPNTHHVGHLLVGPIRDPNDRTQSVMESPAKFPINLPRLVPVKSAKGQTVIQLYAEICHVQRGYGNSISPLGETFSHSEINGGVAGQIGPGILRLWRPVQPVCEPRAVVHIARSIAVPGKTRIDAPIQCVSLIMVYRRVSRRYVERAIRSNG